MPAGDGGEHELGCGDREVIAMMLADAERHLFNRFLGCLYDCLQSNQVSGALR